MFSAYDLKKIIPRAIFALVIANLSWSLMTVMIGGANFLGDSVQALILAPFESSGLLGLSLGGSSTGTFAAIAIVGGGAAVLGLIPIFGVAVAALFGLLFAFGIILLRRVALVGLVIVAPIAIALSVFPQTEKWAKNWWEWFLKLLLMYPFIMAFFGLSEVAAGIISRQGENGVVQVIYDLSALAILVMPYFIVGKAFSLAGGAMGKIAGMVNNKDRGAIDKAKKWEQGRVAENRAKTKAGTRYSDKTGTRSLNRGLGLLFNRGSKTRAEQSFQQRKAQIKETHKAIESLTGDEAQLLAESMGSEAQLKRAIETMAQKAYDDEMEKKKKDPTYAAKSLSQLRAETEAKARAAKLKAGGRLDAGVASAALEIAVGKGSITNGAKIEKLSTGISQTALGTTHGGAAGAATAKDLIGGAVGAQQQKLIETTTAINQAEQAGNFELADTLRESAGIKFKRESDGSTSFSVGDKGIAHNLRELGTSNAPGENKSDLGAKTAADASSAGLNRQRDGLDREAPATVSVTVPPSPPLPPLPPIPPLPPLPPIPPGSTTTSSSSGSSGSGSSGAFKTGQRVVHTKTNSSGVVVGYASDGQPNVEWDTVDKRDGTQGSGIKSNAHDKNLRPM